jgi:outer membrane lipoprotein-sorting protein
MKKLITQKTLSLKRKLKNKISYEGLTAFVAFCFFILQISSPIKALAEEKFLEKNRIELNQIESYLNNIKNLSAKFVQESNGTILEGKFFLARNSESAGKMRVEYLAQPKILIVANGAVLSYYDVELDEVSHLSTNTTPASFLTRPNISFAAKDIEITGFKKTSDQIKVSVMKKNRKEAGEFSLIFHTNPLSFSKMEVKNDLGQIIIVSLSEIDFKSQLPDKLFVIKNKNLP